MAQVDDLLAPELIVLGDHKTITAGQSSNVPIQDEKENSVLIMKDEPPTLK